MTAILPSIQIWTRVNQPLRYCHLICQQITCTFFLQEEDKEPVHDTSKSEDSEDEAKEKKSPVKSPKKSTNERKEEAMSDDDDEEEEEELQRNISFS